MIAIWENSWMEFLGFLGIFCPQCWSVELSIVEPRPTAFFCSLWPCPNFCPLWFNQLGRLRIIRRSIWEKSPLLVPRAWWPASRGATSSPHHFLWNLHSARLVGIYHFGCWSTISSTKMFSKTNVHKTRSHVQYDKVKWFNCAFDDLELHISASITTKKTSGCWLTILRRVFGCKKATHHPEWGPKANTGGRIMLSMVSSETLFV